MTKDRAQRAGDFVSGEQPGCHLVEHRAEEMIVPLVDQRHIDGSVAQTPSSGKSSETATDDDHTRQHPLHSRKWNLSFIRMREEIASIRYTARFLQIFGELR